MAFAGASVPLPAAVAEAVRGAGPDVVLGLRPEALHLSEDGAIGASVVIVELLGAETHVICHTETGATHHRAPERLGGQAQDRRGRAHRRRPRPRRVPPLRRRRRDPVGGRGVTAVASARPPARCRRRGPGTSGRQAAATLRSRRRKQALLAYVLIFPAMVLFAVFSFYPFLRNFKLMLYETPPVPGLPAHYVGLHQIIPTITST